MEALISRKGTVTTADVMAVYRYGLHNKADEHGLQRCAIKAEWPRLSNRNALTWFVLHQHTTAQLTIACRPDCCTSHTAWCLSACV